MNLQLLKEIQILDKKGRVEYTSGVQKGDSFVKGYGGIEYTEMYNTCVTLKDIYGTDRSIGPTAAAYYSHYIKVGAGDATRGIVVGTGDTPVTNDDYKLEAQIMHGSGEGQLDHQALYTLGFDSDASSTWWGFYRTFFNRSTPITVKEIGMYCLARWCGDSSRVWRICIIRDVITPINVPNLQTLLVKYWLKTEI